MFIYNISCNVSYCRFLNQVATPSRATVSIMFFFCDTFYLFPVMSSKREFNENH